MQDKRADYTQTNRSPAPTIQPDRSERFQLVQLVAGRETSWAVISRRSGAIVEFDDRLLMRMSHKDAQMQMLWMEIRPPLPCETPRAVRSARPR
ncbi:hypothetical protein ACFSCV_08795 [Methylopila henanensis]|uniref:Uncharacterized protein n=1 Tax=Methylopila henanensis TaxID=873516 RepID=A0ABW4K7L8_9HYPH